MSGSPSGGTGRDAPEDGIAGLSRQTRDGRRCNRTLQCAAAVAWWSGNDPNDVLVVQGLFAAQPGTAGCFFLTSGSAAVEQPRLARSVARRRTVVGAADTASL